MSPDSTPRDVLAGLVEKARSGSDEAFDRLARHVLPKLRRWALTKTGDPDDADEVAQQVLVRMHSGLVSFRGDARFSTWLYRVTARTAVDLHRSRRARERKREALMGELALNEQRGNPSGRIENANLVALVHRFFRDLSETQREVFDLVDLQGYDPSEAAELLEMNGNTLRVHLHRARRKIREALLEVDPTLAKEYGR